MDLAEIRHKAELGGFPMREVCERAQVSYSTVWRAEQLRSKMTTRTLKALADAVCALSTERREALVSGKVSK